MSKRSFALLYRMLSGFIALCLLSADLAGAAALIDFQGPEPIGAPIAVVVPPAEEQALFRTTVTLRQPRDLERVRDMGVVVLSADEASALLLVTAPQLADLARLRFAPAASDELGVLLQAAGQSADWLRAELQPVLERGAVVSRQWSSRSVGLSDGDLAVTEAANEEAAELAGLLAGITTGQRAAIAPLAPADADGDGLTDTQEGWWCTDAANANSDGVGANDGAEVTALLNFTLSRAVRWGHGAPFGPPNPWPDFNNRDGNPNTPACNDGDYDTIPDFAEVYMVGSRVPEETTDLDKFDDGQELFGTTFCPGGTASCDYGSYPRIEYWNYIKASMPSWVQPPGDNLFVAAFPEPEVSVVAGSWTVERVTRIETLQGEMTETTNSYATTVTEGQGSSIADTKTWTNWQEVSRAVERPLDAPSSQANMEAQPTAACQPSDWWCRGTGALKMVTADLTYGYMDATCDLLHLGCLYKEGLEKQLLFDLEEGINDAYAVDGFQLDADYRQKKPTTSPEVTSNETRLLLSALERGFDYQGNAQSLNGLQTAINQQGQLVARAMYDVSYQLSRPRVTETTSSGSSVGGAQTNTHEQYEEHAITNGQQFTTGQNWSTAWAVDSAHAADLRFTYRVDNTGTEYFRELSNLVFNIYLGDDTTPLVSYPAWQQFANGKIENFFPADAAKQFASTPVPLTLEQMKRIDLGEKLTIIVEDFSYGADENFYQDAITGGVEVLIEDGTADGDEDVDRYVIPTWGVESVQDVLTRFFPATEDAQGNLISLKTGEFNGTNPPSWNEYALTDIAWWNVYQSCSSDCANVGATPLQEQMAQAGSSILFRFNRDSDRDGYKDSVEWRYGTDRNDPADHPTPEMLAGYTLTRNGNAVTGLLKLQNNGTFDAYGIDAVIYAPDDSITITNNTVGGNGRVRAGDSVAVGALIQPPNLANMGNSTAKVYAQGNYSGNLDRVYTFTVQNAGVVGAGNTSLTWSDGASGNGVLQLGSSYHPPLPLPVANGLEVGLDSGTLTSGARFTVQTLIPRDTFKFTINREPYTPPVVVVSYSDPQGSHRFVTPVQLGSLEDDLNAYTGQMLPGGDLSISANGPFNPSGNNATDFILNSPDGHTIEGAKLYLDFISDGKLVKEIVQTFDQQPGPTVRSATWSAASFNADYHPGGDNILLAFWTDAQDNIIDSAARPFNTFQDDPTAVLEVEAEALTWNFGAARQGTLLQRPILIGNTGRQVLLLRAGAANGATLVGPQTVEAGGLGAYTLALDTTPLAVGPYSAQVTIRTSDPANPTVTVNVSGTIQAGTADTGQGGIQRPLDWPLLVSGPRSAGEWVVYSHNLAPDPASLHPARVYSEDYSTLLGTGRYATEFGAGTAPGDMFGDGRDGVMPASGNLDNNNGIAFGQVSGSAGSTSVSVTDYWYISRVNPGDVVLIHQTQYAGAGNWELNRAVSDFTGSGTFGLLYPLKYTYSAGAQIIRVPQYASCNVTGTVTPRASWNGTWGGIIAVMCNGPLTISGAVNANGLGFRGGERRIDNVPQDRGHTGEGHLGFYNSLDVDCWIPPNSRGNGGGSGHGWIPHNGGPTDKWSSGGGGGSNQASGNSGSCSTVPDKCWCWGWGAGPVGSTNMSSVFLGGGGGGGGAGKDGAGDGGAGGDGGGFIYLSARTINITGEIRSHGTTGEAASRENDYTGAAGGGGAGGSIYLRGSSISLGSGAVSAIGGSGGAPTAQGFGGGAGGFGYVYLEYCDNYSGISNPIATTSKLNCYIAEQTETAPYTQGRLNIPEGYTDEARVYAIQYARRFVYTAAGEQTSTLRAPAGVFNSSTLHALVSDVGSGDVTVKLDVGNDGTWDWQATQAVSNAADLASPDLATAFNAYWTSHGAPSSGNVDVPARVYLSKPGQVLLTDLQMTGGGSSLRYVRLPATTYGSVALDLAVAGSGSGSLTLAADVGDDGTVDWSTSNSGPFPRALTSGDLSAAVNAYLTGKSGDVDVPVRLTYTPFNGITISRAAATPAARPDGSIANADVSLTQTNLTEGDTTTVNATVRSNGAAIDGVTVGFFASLPNGLDWYLGSRYLPAVSPSGTATSLVWDTTGFTGASTVKVIIDPYNTLAETNENNNQGTKAATIKTRPNLRPTAITPATLFPVSGQTITVDVTVQNNGQSPSAAATCSLYVGNPDDGGALIGSQACGPLGANTSVTLTYPWTPGAVGPARLFARADSGGALAEPDEFDNDRWLDLDVSDPGPMPPYAPGNPNPADNAGSVAVNTNLSWTGGDPNPGNTVTYKVYLDTANPPATLKITQSATTYDPPGDLLQCTTYYWQIVATDNTSRTTNGPVWSFATYCPANTPPTAPSGPTPANGATGVTKTPQLCWSASSDTDGDPITYDVYLGTANPPTAVVSANQSGTCYTSGALAGHTTTYWRVVAKDNRGGSTAGGVWSFTTLNTAPTAPSGPNPANGATGITTSTQVCWTASADGDGDAVTYDVAFGTSNPPSTAATGQGSLCYDPPGDLAANTTYYWRVTAKDAFGGTTAGSMWSFTTAALPNNPPNAPTNLSPAPGATGVALTAALSWSGSDPDGDPLTYEVRFGTANPPPTVVAGQSATTYDPPGNLAAHTTLYWQIVAKDAAHPNGTPGPVWQFTTANTAPAAPSNPTPANGATNVALGTQVCWTAATDPDGDAVTYDVAFGTSNPPPAAATGQSATCYDPPGDLTAGTPYYWKVTAKDAFGGSAPGSVWSFTTAGGGGTFPDVFYLSPSANVTIGGIAAQGADVLRYTKSTNSWAMLFDGSDHGLTKNISAFTLTDDGRLLFVLVANQAIAGLGTATPFDVVQFTPNTPGVYPLGAGTFSMYFQGQLKGLTASGEKIDAIDLVGNRLLLSTGGAASVGLTSGGTLKAADEDVFVFNVGTNAYESALLIDGSKMPGMAVEDITGIWDDPQSGDYYVTILGTFNLGGVKGNDKSIVKLTPNGGASVYTPSLVSWLASGATLPTGFKIDGLEMAR